MLLWTLGCMYLLKLVFLFGFFTFFPNTYPAVGLLGYMVVPRRRQWHPTQYSCLKNPMDWGAMGSLRVGHNWATSLSLFTFMHWRRKWQPTPVFLPENPRDGGAWWAAVSGVAQSQTRLKQLSSSSSSSMVVPTNSDHSSLFSTSSPAFVICVLFDDNHSVAWGDISLWFWLAFPWW